MAVVPAGWYRSMPMIRARRVWAGALHSTLSNMQRTRPHRFMETSPRPSWRSGLRLASPRLSSRSGLRLGHVQRVRNNWLEAQRRREVRDVRLQPQRQIDDRRVGRRSLGHQISLAQLQLVQSRRQLVGVHVWHKNIVARNKIKSLLGHGELASLLGRERQLREAVQQESRPLLEGAPQAAKSLQCLHADLRQADDRREFARVAADGLQDAAEGGLLVGHGEIDRPLSRTDRKSVV